tara:strand:+ start:429 stop:932 length:504 start_codon:yes stop_codon:yes gene_type:complete
MRHITAQNGDLIPVKTEISEIAKSLSKLCRYGGDIDMFYSVAEHCVLMAQEILRLGGSKEEAKSILLHDASEATWGDIKRGLKDYIVGYRFLEDATTDLIFEIHHIQPMTERCHWLDTNIVRDEAEVLFDIVPDWVHIYDPTGIEISVLTCDQAQTAFLYMWEYLNS